MNHQRGRCPSRNASVILAMGCLLIGAALFVMPGMSQAAPAPEMDLMFVIDNSGSMHKNDPGFLTPRTVRTFMNQLPDETRVGMVLFDQKARLLESLSPLSDSQAKQRLIASLNQVDYKGRYTNSAAGIERALYELKTSGRAQANKCIIFLTDGIVDTGRPQKDLELTQWLKNDLASECRDLGVRIFGIAFTENADFVLIQALAARTDGAYFRAYAAEDIAGVLDQIQAQLTPPPEEAPEKSPVIASPPEPQPSPQAAAPEATALAQSAPPPAPATSGGRSFLKFYLPLILIIFLLIGALLFLMAKVFGQPSWLVRQLAVLYGPGDKANAAQIALPQWQLRELDQGRQESVKVHDFNKARVTIGRDVKNDLQIPQPTVSNLHAAIEYKEGAFYLDDQRSTNGTRLNDRQVSPNQPVRLKSGDRIQFANFTYKFVRLDQILSGDTVMLSVTALSEKEASRPVSRPSRPLDDEQRLRVCLEKHVAQIEALGPKYKHFMDLYFPEDTLNAITIQAHENMQQTLEDQEQHCSPLIKGKAFIIVCTLPVSIVETPAWFGDRYGGFSQFITQWIKSEAYDVTSCDLLCVVTFGHDAGPWVSMTLVPTHEDPDPVEIMSVDFLSESEKAALALDFDDHGRVL